MSQLTFEEQEGMLLSSLYSGYVAFRQAGEKAREEEENHGKDLLTKGDLMIGNAIIEEIKQAGKDFILYSEENGRKVFGDNPEFSVVLDECDGSGNLKDGDGMAPFGSIMGISNSLDPTFDEIDVAGFLEFTTGNLYSATKNKGAYKNLRFGEKMYEGSTQRDLNQVPIKTSGKKDFVGTRIMNDQYMLGDISGPISDYAGKKHWPKDLGCKAAHIAMIAYGGQDLFISANNCATKKETGKLCSGEELGPGYLLVKEAGGATLDFNYRDIGGEKIGLGEKRAFDFVMGATEELAKRLISDMRQDPRVEAYIRKQM